MLEDGEAFFLEPIRCSISKIGFSELTGFIGFSGHSLKGLERGFLLQ
jgi:hypothetical protein